MEFPQKNLFNIHNFHFFLKLCIKGKTEILYIFFIIFLNILQKKSNIKYCRLRITNSELYQAQITKFIFLTMYIYLQKVFFSWFWLCCKIDCDVLFVRCAVECERFVYRRRSGKKIRNIRKTQIATDINVPPGIVADF